MTATTRRELLGAIAAAPAVLTAMPAAAVSSVLPDPVWPKLVADYRTKYAAWLATIDLEDDAAGAFFDACASLPSEPKKPGSGLPNDIFDMTIREIHAVGELPTQKAAWAAYEHDHAAWKVQRDALYEHFVEPAKVAYAQTSEARYAALNALMSYRVNNLRDLGEKINIIAAEYAGDDIPHQYLTDVLADVHHLGGEA